MENNQEAKKQLIEILEKNPILQPACDRCGIGRSTFYRWKQEDKAFAKDVDKAIVEGRILVSELAESKLMSAIKSENLGAIRYWLTNNDPRYSNKLELDGHLLVTDTELTPEQEASIRKALLFTEPEEGDKDGK